jgi:hypothetical protein
MNIMIIGIVLLIIIFILCKSTNNNNEGFVEGTYKRLYSGLPYIKTNFSSSLYPICQENTRNNGSNERYCDDRKKIDLSLEKLYGNSDWVLTKYPSYFYPPYSTSARPHYVYSSDYWHRWKT